MPKISNKNAIPNMTSNTAPSGVAKSSTQTTSLDAFRAFDGKLTDNANRWASALNSPVSWLSYTFAEPKSIGKYVIYAIGTVGQSPKTWTFEGSNDEVTWDILDSHTNVSDWVAYASKEFTIPSSKVKPYKTYRINIVESNVSNITSIQELEMYEVEFIKGLILKNEEKLYSLDDKELINIPEASIDIIDKYGVKNGKEINLNEEFNKMSYVVDSSEVLGEGKKFTHAVDATNTKINKIIL